MKKERRVCEKGFFYRLVGRKYEFELLLTYEALTRIVYV